ncbi:MAG: hypothetical protein MRY59_02410 [Aquisalinus sp.]|nr:hypothetical protein [Aquisalinus sp.]
MQNIWQTLKENSYFRAIAGYLMVGWVAMQVMEVMGPALNLPEWTLSAAAYLVISGFPVFLLITWLLLQKSSRQQAEDGAAPSSAFGKWDYALYGVAALAVAIIAIQWALPGDTEEPTASVAEDPATEAVASNATSSPAAPAPGLTPGNFAIAVMPFDDLSAAQDQAYFSDGISEEIIYTLSRIDRLDVTARTSSFAFKGQNLSSPEIGQRLGVSHVISGAVRKQNNQVRITIQLTDTTSDQMVWSESFTHTLEDVFKVQEEIALAVAEELEFLVGEEDQQYLVSRTAQNPAAYEAFLQARYLLNSVQIDAIDRAIGLLQEAVEIDPQFAEAWAELGMAYWQKQSYGGDVSNELDLAELNALKSLALNPQNSQAYVVLGITAAKRRDYVAMRTNLEKALALNSNDPLALRWFAYGLLTVGEVDEALTYSARTLKLDPMQARNYVSHATNLYVSGDLGEARRTADRAITLGFRTAAMVMADVSKAEGDAEGAMNYARPLISYMTQVLSDEEIETLLRGIFIGQENTDEAVRLITELANQPDSAAQMFFGNFLVMLEEPALAFETFRTNTGGFDFPFFVALWSDRGEMVRTSDAFPGFARDIGLVEYWQAYEWPPFCSPDDPDAEGTEVAFACL